MKIRQLTVAIGAEISGVNLGDASRDDGLFAEIKAALLKHRVLFMVAYGGGLRLSEACGRRTSDIDRAGRSAPA